jgi:uncharacterized protein
MWIGALLAVVLIPLAGIWILQRRLVFQPDPTDPGPAAAALRGGLDVRLHTSDGLDLGAWYFPATGGCRTTVLVAPGNAGNRAGRIELARKLGERGLGVLLLDYRGYGGNPGSPTEVGLARDARAAWEFLHHTLHGQHRLVYFGESLGGAVLSALAVDEPPDALVLRSPFVDLASAAGRLYPMLPVRLMLWDRFPVVQNIAKLKVPVTVILGENDNVISPDQSLAVARATQPPAIVVTVRGANHNDAELVHGKAVIDAVQRGSCGSR